MKLNIKAKKLVKSQCAVILAAQDKSGSSGRWPMPILKSTVEASIFSEPVLAKFFYNRVSTLLEKGYSFEKISLLFPYASPLARLMMIFRSRKIWPMTADEKIEVANWLAEILYYHYKKDHFVVSGENILWDSETVNKLSFLKKDVVRPALVAKLDGKLWMYTEMLFSRWHNLGHEFHGSYDIKNKKEKLLVKEWHDLKGLGWNIFKNFPYKKIVCYEFYKNNDVSLDLHNRLFSKRPIIQSVTRCVIKADDKILNNSEVNDLLKKMDDFLLAGAKYLSGMNKKELKITNAYMEFYAIKPLADELGENWQPPQELLMKIEEEKLGQKEVKLLEILQRHYKKMDRKTIKMEFDPSAIFE